MYTKDELLTQIDGLMLRIKRLKFLRAHTQDTRKIDLDIRKDELQVIALQHTINTLVK
jgi:hypothetical protein